MATGKHRTTKRSSGGSYTSTVSTVVFVCIFILGVWILTSNSYASSNKSTTRISQNASSRYSFRKIPIDPPAFEDNPGDLPEDAIQPDDGSGTRFDHPATGSNETKSQAESTMGMEVDKQPHVEKEVEEIQMSEESRKTQNKTVDNTTGIEDHTRKSEHQGKENQKQTHVTGDDKMGMVNNEEQYTSEDEQEKRNENDMQTYATGGNDKGGVVTDEEHDITQDEQEHPQHEETSNDQIQQNEEKPANETKPPVEEVKTETNTTAIAIITPTKDSKVATDSGTMTIERNSTEIPMESNESKKEWKTQAGQSDNEKERQQEGRSDVAEMADDHKWELCNVTSGADYVPCLDNEKAIKKLVGRNHFEHRERHCPEVGPTCLVPIPEDYRSPIPWPHSRDKASPYVPTITNYTQLWWVPNVVVAHAKEGIEVLHLASGRTLCKLHLQEGGLHADINGDGVLDHVQAVGGNGAEQTVVSGSMEVLKPCWAVATSGVPVREQLFNVSICHRSHFNLFPHGEYSRSFGRATDVNSLEVATPILIPTNDGHKHRKGSHGDIAFLTNRGEVTAYSPGLHGHEAVWQWQLLTGATWSNLPSPAGMMDAGYVIPTLKPLNLRMHDNQHFILAAGDQEVVVISAGGSQLTSIDLPAPPTHALVDADFSNDGLTDLIVVTSNGVYGFVQTRQPGALFFSILVGCLIVVMGIIFVTQHLNSMKGKPRVPSGHI